MNSNIQHDFFYTSSKCDDQGFFSVIVNFAKKQDLKAYKDEILDFNFIIFIEIANWPNKKKQSFG